MYNLSNFCKGESVNLPAEENTPQKRVDKIFDLMDKVSFTLSINNFHEI